MLLFRSWERFDETHSETRRLIIVGDLSTRQFFVRQNRLTPAYELDYDEMCTSLDSLFMEDFDIIVSYTTPVDICKVIIKLEQSKIKDGSVVFLYHKFDIKTGTYCDCNRRVLINGSLVIDGDYNFYRTGLNPEQLSDEDFKLIKTAFKDTSLTKDHLLSTKSENCKVTIKEGMAIRTNSIDVLQAKKGNGASHQYIYLLGGCVWSSNYSTPPNKIKQVFQRLLDDLCPRKYTVEHISNVGSNEKILVSLKRARLKAGGLVFIGNVDKPEVALAAARICEKQKCTVIVYLFPNILARKCPSEYERRIIERGWGNNVSELQEQLAYHKNVLDELGFLGIEAYEPPSLFFESKKTLLLDFSGVHLGDWANEIIARHMTAIVLGKERSPVRCKRLIETTRSLISDIVPGVNFFSAELEAIHNKQGHENCGAIVMSCNPFTNGHKYLIEHASSRVEHLYIFVVQEDCLDFTFEERYSLVKENISQLDNVTILPGGRFVISNITFGDYFSRAEIQEEERHPDAVLDILIFASIIAPALRIRTRFVGSEPLCRVTRSYNEQMERILPEYGCDVVEVPRLTLGDTVISASMVRKLLNERDFNGIKALVPKQSFDYLRKKYLGADCDI